MDISLLLDLSLKNIQIRVNLKKLTILFFVLMVENDGMQKYKNDFELCLESCGLKIISLLGKGCFGSVYVCKDDQGEICAYKIFLAENCEVKCSEREFGILKNISGKYPNYKFLVKMFERIEKNPYLIFKMEYIHGRVFFFL
jgi:hypothetical protein